MQDRFSDVFPLKKIDKRVQAEKDEEGKDLKNPQDKSRKQKCENDGAREGEAVAEELSLGERHHERKNGDEIARRQQNAHIGAERQGERGDRAGDRGKGDPVRA